MFGIKYRFQDVSFTPPMLALLKRIEEVNWFKERESISNYTDFNLHIIKEKQEMLDYFSQRNYSYENSLTTLYYEINNQISLSLYNHNSSMRDNTWERLDKEIDKQIKSSKIDIDSINRFFNQKNKTNVNIRIETLLKFMFYELYYSCYFPNLSIFGLKVLPLLEKGYTIIGWDGFQKDEDIDTEDELHGEDYKIGKEDGKLVLWK